jgi:hypothetical protein
VASHLSRALVRVEVQRLAGVRHLPRAVALATATLAAVQGGLLLTQTTRDPGRLAIALDAAYAYLRAHAPAR